MSEWHAQGQQWERSKHCDRVVDRKGAATCQQSDRGQQHGGKGQQHHGKVQQHVGDRGQQHGVGRGQQPTWW